MQSLDINVDESSGTSSSEPLVVRTGKDYAMTVIVFLAVLAFYSLPLASIPFSSHGEAREAVVVQNMVQQNNLILPLRNGVDVPSKPPGFHWLAIITSQVTGSVSEFSIRFPSALASAAGLTLTFIVIATLLGRDSAILAVLMLCTSFEWARSSSLARVDMVFTLCVGASLIFLYRIVNSHTHNRESGSFFSLIAAIFFLTGATLTKGPAGLGIPLIIASAFSITISYANHRIRGVVWFRQLLPLVFVGGCAAALSAVWYYLAYLEAGNEFLRVHIVRENVARLLGTESYEAETGHHAPFYYGIVLLVAGLLPWSLLLPITVSHLWRERRALLTPSSRPLLFALLWSAAFFAIITVSGSKRTVYFLPAFPPTVLIILWAVREIKLTEPITNIVRITAGTLSALLWLACAAAGISRVVHLSPLKLLPLSERSAHAAELVWGSFVTSVAPSAILLIAGWQLFVIARRRYDNAYAYIRKISLAFIVIIFGSNQFVYPALAREKSPRDFMLQVRSLVPQDEQLFQFRDNLYSSIYYANSNLTFTSDVKELAPLSRAFILTEERYLPEVLDNLPGSQIVLTSTEKVSDGRDRLVLVSYSSRIANHSLIGRSVN